MPEESQAPERRRFLQDCVRGALAAAAAGVAGCAPRTVGAAPFLPEPPRAGEDDERYWKTVRRQFPLEPGLAYFNTGGLGPSPTPVIDALVREMNALERVGETGHERVQAVREKASAFLNCAAVELAITRNATEGMNLIARGLSLRDGDEVLLTTHEHPGGLMPWMGLAKDVGIRVKLIEPGAGGADTLNRIADALTPRTRVVSVSHILCTTGLRVPAREITRLCREKNLVSVLDGAQAVGMIPVDLHDLGCDFYTASGHKWLLGPKGTGFLYVRSESRELWRPSQVGAWSDKKDQYDPDKGVLEYLDEARVVEYGTRNTPIVVALGAAADFLSAIGMERVAARGRALALHLRRRLETLPDVEILTPTDETASASILTMTAADPARDARAWASPLKSRYKIRARVVSEHGLKGLRVCPHVFTSYEELDRLADALTELTRV